MDPSIHADFLVPHLGPERRAPIGGRRAGDLAPAQQAAIADAVLSYGDIVSGDSEGTAALLQLIDNCQLLISNAEYSIMMRENGGEVRVVAASSAAVRAIDEQQLKAREGPSIDAFGDGGSVPEEAFLASSEVWQRFAALMRLLDFKRLYALPLHSRSAVIGVLNVYIRGAQDTPGVKMAWIRTLARSAAAGLDNARSHAQLNELASQLQRALDSRVLIEQAKGMIGAQLDVTMDAAFEILRNYSRSHNYRVQQVASELVAKRRMAHELMVR